MICTTLCKPLSHLEKYTKDTKFPTEIKRSRVQCRHWSSFWYTPTLHTWAFILPWSGRPNWKVLYTCLPLQIRRSGSHGYFRIEARPAFPSLLDQTGSNFNASPWYYIISVALHKMPAHISPWKRGHACASACSPWNKQRFKGIYQLTCMSVSTISTSICPKDSKSPTYFVSLCMCTILSQLGATPWQKSLTRNMRSAAFGDNGQTHGDFVELQFLQKWEHNVTYSCLDGGVAEWLVGILNDSWTRDVLADVCLTEWDEDS